MTVERGLFSRYLGVQYLCFYNGKNDGLGAKHSLE